MNAIIALLILCIFLCMYRVGKGPTAPDRTVAIDILGTLVVGFCALVGLYPARVAGRMRIAAALRKSL